MKVELVKNKKLAPGIVIAVLYLSFCAAEFMTFRGTYAALMSNFGTPSAFFANYIFAFILAGLFPTVIYEFITRFIFRFSQARIGGNTESMAYNLRFYYIAANLVIFLVKLIYLWHPIAHIYGDILIDFVVTALAFAAFLFFTVRKQAKERIAPILYQLGGSFIIVYGLLMLITVILEVL